MMSPQALLVLMFETTEGQWSYGFLAGFLHGQVTSFLADEISQQQLADASYGVETVVMMYEVGKKTGLDDDLISQALRTYAYAGPTGTDSPVAEGRHRAATRDT